MRASFVTSHSDRGPAAYYPSPSPLLAAVGAIDTSDEVVVLTTDHPAEYPENFIDDLEVNLRSEEGEPSSLPSRRRVAHVPISVVKELLSTNDLPSPDHPPRFSSRYWVLSKT